MAPKADLRPFQMAALSASDCDTLTALGRERLGDGDDAAEQVVDLGLRALDLDDQHRLDVERVAGMGEGLADLDRRPVHVFDRDRDDAGADDGGDAGARRLGASKPSSIGRAPSAARRMRTVASVTMPSWPSEPMTRPSRS